MDVKNEEFRISVWHGNRRKDILSVQQWLDNVEEVRGKFKRVVFNCKRKNT